MHDEHERKKRRQGEDDSDIVEDLNSSNFDDIQKIPRNRMTTVYVPSQLHNLDEPDKKV